MKAIRTLIISLLLLFVASFPTYANLGNYNFEMPMGLAYQIQVGPLQSPMAASLKATFDHVQEETTAEGKHVYYLGQFATYRDASVQENTLRHHGCNTAKVVAWFSKYPIPVEDGIAFENDLNHIDKAYIHGTEPTVPVDDLNALLDLQQEPGSFYYSVQVGVFATVDPNSPAMKLHNVTIRQNNKGYYTVSCGRVSTMLAAQDLRQSLIKKGYNDAFITAYAKGERLSTFEAMNIETELSKISLVAR